MSAFPLPLRLPSPGLVAFLAAGLLTAACVLPASAGTITTYTAYDNGSPVGGPFPNSSAAQSSFLAAAAGYGSINTITFENLPVGFTTSAVTVASGVTETQSGANFGNGGSGISNTSLDPGSDAYLYGFNTTAGGSYFLGTSEDTTTFNFASPTNSFGFYATGLQNVASTTLSLTFNDGTAETVSFNDIASDGGAGYYSFTDTSAFSSVTLVDIPGGDYWGIDDVSYNSAAATSVTPEPSSLLLLGTGTLAMAQGLRRRILQRPARG